MQTTERPGDPVARNRDVNTRGVLLAGLWLGVAAVVISAAMWGLMRWLDRSLRAAERPLAPSVAASLKRTPPEPRLEPQPLLPRQRLRAEEDTVLKSYAWVDRPGGIVRIPIDRAMELIAERGLPPSKPMPAVAPMPPPGATPPPIAGGAR
ncbi:MAG TPA: hypothetical protein VJ776_05940 [Thermoanaerobaculia bacterium]|nr:hypothetical protein [Thermoanaerobaculia bacterium]